MSQYPQLDSTVSGLRASGVPDDKIIRDALAAGWSNADIAAAFATVGASFPAPQNIHSIPASAPLRASYANIAPAENRPQKSGKGKFAVVAVVIVLVVAGTGYAYTKGMFSFLSKAPYSESNLISGVLSKFTEVQSSSYAVSASLYVEPREADAEPFTLKLADNSGLKEKYMRDYNRSQDIPGILGALMNFVSSNPSNRAYPNSLAALRNSPSAKYYSVSTVDPLTNRDYEYSTTADGSDFRLTVTFETPDALKAINKSLEYQKSTTTKSTIVSGNTVTFTKNSNSYAYYFGLSSKPPENYFQKLGSLTQYLPPEMNIEGSITAASNLASDAGVSEWKVNVEGTGDLGDLTYKVSVDALKKDADYYIKVNNIPSFFMGMVPSKGQWYKISPKKTDVENPDYSNYSSVLSGMLSGAEKSYSEQKKQTADLLKNVAHIADEEGLIHLKGSPRSEKIGDRVVYRYDIGINKEAMVSFYKKLSSYAEEQNNSTIPVLTDAGFINYLESGEFSEVFDYYIKNTSTTVWVDDKGFLAAAEYSIRVVPPDEAVNLKDKQVMFKMRMSFEDINKPVDIKVPADAKDIETATAGAASSLSSARAKAVSASIKATLSGVRAQAEVVYSKSNNGYGTKAFPLGLCRNAAGTLFADAQVYKAITDISRIASSTPMCVS